MEYIELLSSVKEAGNFQEICLNCCDPQKDNFSLLRAQLRGQLLYSVEDGVCVRDAAGHDKKCEGLIRSAREEEADLLLFPEYCVSYALLREMMSQKELWPGNGKLWCLPCQGIPNQEFDDFLKECEAKELIFLYREAWAEQRVDRKYFVNALFYVFVAFLQDEPNQKKLCMVPQLKTQHMADGGCECEAPGLTTGKLIYQLNNKLVTFLCADSLNNDVVWQDLQKQNLSSCIFLHPQLNERPKDFDFRRVREEMLRHNADGCYISCNWANDTVMSGKNAEDSHGEHRINLSWSCIYRKFSGRSGFSEWVEREANHRKNRQQGLFGAYIKRSNTEVWFSCSEEHVLLANVPAVQSLSLGVTSAKDVCARKRLCFCEEEPGRWENTPFVYSLQGRIDRGTSQYMKESSEKIEEDYRYPLTASDKYDTDRFFSLTLADFPAEIMEMDENENPVAWTLLLSEQEAKTAEGAIHKVRRLISFFKKQCFPKNMDIFNRERMFTYVPPEHGKPSANLTAGDRYIIVAIAEHRAAAERHVHALLKNECHGDKDLLKECVCVLYQEPEEPITSLPPISCDIVRADHVLVKGDVTDGEV